MPCTRPNQLKLPRFSSCQQHNNNGQPQPQPQSQQQTTGRHRRAAFDLISPHHQQQQLLLTPTNNNSANTPPATSTNYQHLMMTNNCSSQNSNNNNLLRPSLIIPYLYVGDHEHTKLETLRLHKITYILSLQALPLFLGDNNTTTKLNDIDDTIRVKCINVDDTHDQLLDSYFDETHEFIDEARQNKCNVLVHCKAGISRSPAITISYLMKTLDLSLKEAYNLVKGCRPQISPNLNFMGQLVVYEQKLQAQRKDKKSTTTTTSSMSPNASILKI